MRLKIADILDEMDEKVTTHGYIYMEDQKGMYGLPHSTGNSCKQTIKAWIHAK